MKMTVKGFGIAAFVVMSVFVLVGCEEASSSASVINIAAIQGITIPVTGATPVRTITENTQYSGTVTWNDSPPTFAADTQYTAIITLTAKTGYTLQGVKANYFTVAGAISVNNSANSGVITVVFPQTSISIIITAPAKGVTPSKTAISNNTNNFTVGEVSWSPNNNPFLGDTVYTATVTLTANNGYTFTGLNSATINEQNATISNNTGKSVTLSHRFPATNTKAVTSIAIKSQPSKLTYTHDNKLDLTGLVVILIHDDTTTEDVAITNFAAKNITANPAQGVSLVHVTHNGQPVTITYGNLTAYTSPLTVAKAISTWVNIATVNTTYTPTLTLGDLTLPASYAFKVPTTKLNAGNSQFFAAIYTYPNGNYEANGNITVNVAKSGPASWPTATAITYGSPLSASTLSGGDTAAGSFAWTNSATIPTVADGGKGCPVTFTPINTANYITTTGPVAITVNKANSGVINAPTLNRYAHNRILINAVTTTVVGQSIEYGISTSNNATTAVWQTELLFTGLNMATNYYIFARIAETANYNVGPASSSIYVTTRPSNVLTVTSTAEWTDTLAHIAAFGNGTAEIPQTYTIMVNGNVAVAGSTANSFGSVSNVVVTLQGNGKLYLTSRGYMIIGTDNQTIIIDSAALTLQGLKNGQNGASMDNNTSLIYCTSTLELRNGIISGNSNDYYRSSFGNSEYYGGGVHVKGTGSSFTMSGGTISGNSHDNNGYIASGGGVYVEGTNSSFTMTGGIISDNSITTDKDNLITNFGGKVSGGGVYVEGTNSSFTMMGGIISDNSSICHTNHKAESYGSYGGGVYVKGTNSSFTMTGGTISNNSSIYEMYNASGSGESCGGGVYFEGGTFTMENGTISNNISRANSNSYSGSCHSLGGGMYVEKGTFTMNGGTISGNSTSGNGGSLGGGGVYCCYDTTMNGGTISNNIVNGMWNIPSISLTGGGVCTNTFTMNGGIISGNSVNAMSYNYCFGGGVFAWNFFTKTGGIIYGDDASNTNKNTVTGTTNAYGHAVYYSDKWCCRDSTLGENDNLYSSSPLPTNSGQTLNGWTKR